ncbi:MAG: tetratricopeptide repeat protein [Phycisphaerae bacterium]
MTRTPVKREARAVPRAPGARGALPALALLLLATVPYFPALRAGFIWDDDEYVVNNVTLRSVDGLRRIWFELGATPQYYPLVFTTFWVEHAVWGLHPAGYHATNLALHALAALLLWRVLLRLGVPGAWLAAALFAVHPVQAESVAWVTERKNVLSAALYFATLRAWLRFAPWLTAGSASNGRRDPAGHGSSRAAAYALALALFMAALLSKTITCTLPAAILLIAWWRAGRIAARDAWPTLPLFVAGAAAGFVTVWMELHNLAGTGAGARGPDWDLSATQRVLVAGRAFWFYLGKLAWPAELVFVYPRWDVDPRQLWQWTYPAALVALVATLWFARRRIGRGPLATTLFFAGTLFPALGFFNVYPFRYSFVADHFQYLASAGPFALVAAVAVRALRRVSNGAAHATSGEGKGGSVGVRAAGRGLATIGLIALATLTWRQTNVHRDLETLWRDTIAKNPAAWMAHANLGLVLGSQRRFDEALHHHEAAVRLRPGDPQLHINRGAALAALNRLDAAIAAYRDARALDAAEPAAHFNLGNALARRGDLSDAIAAYREALRLKPAYAEALNNLADALTRRGGAGDAAEAVTHLRAALELRPDYWTARFNLGAICLEQGRVDIAVEQFERVTRLRPDFGLAYERWGDALAKSGRRGEAERAYERAYQLGVDEAAAKLARLRLNAVPPP